MIGLAINEDIINGKKAQNIKIHNIILGLKILFENVFLYLNTKNKTIAPINAVVHSVYIDIIVAYNM